MAIKRDLDVPQWGRIEDIMGAETCIPVQRSGKRRPNANDLDDADVPIELPYPRGFEMPGTSVDEEFVMPVVPVQPNEFVCIRCRMVQHRSRMASSDAHEIVCVDCQ